MNDIKLEDVPKMMVIYNALKNGWTVHMIGDNKFNFRKKRIDKELTLNNYFDTFKKYFEN